MKYYLDCEFDGLNGALISMGIVSEVGRSLYAVMGYRAFDPWVIENVVPLVFNAPIEAMQVCGLGVNPLELAGLLEDYFKGDLFPHVISDRPDDIKYLCQHLITGPGQMIDVPGMTFEVKRVDPYPTKLAGAVQHNAWWDAMALRHLLTDGDWTPSLPFEPLPRIN